MQPITCLTIAGSDSGGGAGIQADLRTFSAFQIHGTSAITAITAQNTLEVRSVQAVDTSVVTDQIECVLQDFTVLGVKTGMLASSAIASHVASIASKNGLKNLVVDPVVVSSSGHVLLGEGGIDVYRNELLQHALIVTPNLREAAALAGTDVRDIKSRKDMVAIGQDILKFGSTYVLVKGGHFLETEAEGAPDILVSATGSEVFEGERIVTSNDHGTGCSLSAALAAQLAKGQSISDAVRDAKMFVSNALRGATNWQLGQGRGPIDHLGWNR